MVFCYGSETPTMAHRSLTIQYLLFLNVNISSKNLNVYNSRYNTKQLLQKNNSVTVNNKHISDILIRIA